MVLAVVPLLVAVVGAMMYGLCSGAKLAEIGRILFFVGSLWLVQALAAHVVRF